MVSFYPMRIEKAARVTKKRVKSKGRKRAVTPSGYKQRFERLLSDAVLGSHKRIS